MKKIYTVLLTTIALLTGHQQTIHACMSCLFNHSSEFDNLHNFRWIDHNILAGMALPSTREDIEELIRKNIGLIVTLTCDEVIEDTFVSGRLNPDILAGFAIKTLYLPIKPHQPPTLAQVDEFINAVRTTKTIYQKATVVHCEYGISRTGTMLACWLIKEKGYSAQKAITAVAREASPEQQEFIRNYYEFLRRPAKPGTVFPIIAPSAKDGPTTIEDIASIEESPNTGFVLGLPPLPFQRASANG